MRDGAHRYEGPTNRMPGTTCDLCGSYDIKGGWRLPCADFEMGVAIAEKGNVVHNSDGDWLVCAACYPFFADGNFEATAQRSADIYMARWGLGMYEHQQLLVIMKQTHANAWEHRTGPLVPL
jgi:hypothetical protein